MEKINSFINTEITKGLHQLDELVLEIAQFIRLDIAERILGFHCETTTFVVADRYPHIWLRIYVFNNTITTAFKQILKLQTKRGAY